MSRIEQILSNVVALRDAIDDRISQKVDAILDQSALNASSITNLTRPKAGEVTLFGNFVWNPEVSGQAEIDLLLAGKWSPSTLDFMEATKLSPNFVIGDFNALISSIADYEKDSIARLNFFSHGNSATLGIAGTIVPSNVIFNEYIDQSQMAIYTSSGLTIVEDIKGKQRRITLDDVRKRFKKDAIFVIYACHGGVNRELLRSLRDLFKVTVIGFNHSILYCPPVQNKPPFKRKGTKFGISKNKGGCSGNVVTSDWRSLIADNSAVKFPYIEK